MGWAAWSHGSHLVEVEDKIKLTDILEIVIQDLDEKVDGLKIQKLVVTDIYAQGKEQPCISSVHDLVGPELQRDRQIQTVGCAEFGRIGRRHACMRSPTSAKFVCFGSLLTMARCTSCSSLDFSPS